MSTAWQLLKSLQQHYQIFGRDGIPFLFKKKYKRNAVIDVRIKGYAAPIFLRNDTTDVPMFDYIFQRKEYDIALDYEPEIIIDCGAHIGLSAVFFAHKYPGAVIYALEPEQSNFELLLKNTQHYSNIHCLNYGIWNRSTHLRIIDVGLGNWGFMTEEVDHKGADTVEAISIPDLMSRYGLDRIDLCKINIEGTERELFQKNYENWVSKTRAIVIELHDRMREGCSNAFFEAMTHYHFALLPNGSYLVCILK
jgi:FkbM family methyltransferase